MSRQIQTMDSKKLSRWFEGMARLRVGLLLAGLLLAGLLQGCIVNPVPTPGKAPESATSSTGGAGYDNADGSSKTDAGASAADDAMAVNSADAATQTDAADAATATD